MTLTHLIHSFILELKYNTPVICYYPLHVHPLESKCLSQLVTKEITEVNLMEDNTPKHRNHKRISYLVPTRVEEIFQFHYITVLQASHDLKFTVLKENTMLRNHIHIAFQMKSSDKVISQLTGSI